MHHYKCFVGNALETKFCKSCNASKNHKKEVKANDTAGAGKHFLWRPTLKALLLPGTTYIILFTSVTIYVPKYELMITLLL